MSGSSLMSRLVQKITGREYNLTSSELLYALDKGATPLIRGILWAVLRMRRPNGFLLGARVKILSSHRLALGTGVAIGNFSYLDCSAVSGVAIGDRATLREGCWLQCRSGINAAAERVTIGKGAYIGPYAVIGAGGTVEIGEGTQIGARLTLSAEEHELSDGSFTSGVVARRGIKIGRSCWLGNNVTILDGVTIGDGAVIGAASLVTRDVPANCIAYGVPARVKGPVSRPEPVS